jgi:hypothetical protein
MTLALTAPARIDTVPAAVPGGRHVTARLRLLRRRLRRVRLAWRFMGRDRRMLEDVGVALAPDRPFLADFLRH